jgi:hypothetical protein
MYAYAEGYLFQVVERSGQGVGGVEVFGTGVFLGLFVGVVAGADHGAAFDDADPEGEAELFPVGEFVGVGPAGDGPVLGGGLEVLADGEDVDAVGGDVAEGLLDFVGFFAEAEHDAGLGGEIAGFGVAEDGAGAVVAGLDADGFLEAFDGLEVVVKNIGLGVEDEVEEVGLAFPVGGEDFDGGGGHAVADGADGGGPDGGTAVLEFIAGDGGDDTVAEVHLGDGFGDAGGFSEVVFGGAAGLDGAEITGAGADVTQNHEGGGAAGPAFAEVGALGALANGVELVFVDEFADGVVTGAGREFGAEPSGFTQGIGHRSRGDIAAR